MWYIWQWLKIYLSQDKYTYFSPFPFWVSKAPPFFCIPRFFFIFSMSLSFSLSLFVSSSSSSPSLLLEVWKGTPSFWKQEYHQFQIGRTNQACIVIVLRRYRLIWLSHPSPNQEKLFLIINYKLQCKMWHIFALWLSGGRIQPFDPYLDCPRAICRESGTPSFKLNMKKRAPTEHNQFQ